ncbi:MAG: hypothetical protein ACYTEZ_06355 [Planctomycetota bacterium]|jgi:hypothetical protein
MATTRKKKKRTTKKRTTRARKPAARKPATRKRITAKVRGPKPISVAVQARLSALDIKGDRLVVRISRTTHPEIFDIDRLIKQVHKMGEIYGDKRKMRDLCEFLAETEKSLEIILSNHLEGALRKYLK